MIPSESWTNVAASVAVKSTPARRLGVVEVEPQRTRQMQFGAGDAASRIVAPVLFGMHGAWNRSGRQGHGASPAGTVGQDSSNRW